MCIRDRRFALNTAIAQMIVWVNEASKAPTIGRDQAERFLRILSPFAPHICDELWERLGNAPSVAAAGWPTYDESLTKDDMVEMAVQVNGKVRTRIQVPADADEEELVRVATGQEPVTRAVAGRQIKRVVVVHGRLVNLIV